LDSQFLSQIHATTISVAAFVATRIQRNVVRQTDASRCEGFPMFHGLILLPTSGCSGGLEEPKQISEWHHMK
jgi:hypothetical protein